MKDLTTLTAKGQITLPKDVRFLTHPGILMENKRGVLLALTLYAKLNVDFVDALLSVHMQRAGVPDLVSYDKHFDRLPGIRRQRPQEFLAQA